jgi:hypothetical protein
LSQQPIRGQQFRVLGSGYTVFYYAGSRIRYCQTIQDNPPQPVAPPQDVQGIDDKRPVEIAFAKAVRSGSVVLTIFEEWERDVWRQFFGYRRGVYSDLADVFERATQIGGVQCAKVIRTPAGNKRLVIYHNSVITNIDMSDSIAIDTLTVGRPVTITYTHRTLRGG